MLNRTLTFLTIACSLLFAVSVCHAEPGISPAEMRSDAELWDVFFLDRERGWAVGDRGTIWRTENSGAEWELQETRVGCTLKSIFFVKKNGILKLILCKKTIGKQTQEQGPYD